MKKLIAVLLCLCLLSGFPVAAAEAPLGVEKICYNSTLAAKVSPTHFRLYLPEEATADNQNLDITLTDPSAQVETTVYPEDALSNFSSYEGQDMYMDITLTRETETLSVRVDLIPITGIATMYLTSSDPENEGRQWVEASPDKSNATTGSMVLRNEANEVVYDGALTQIKGRGNSTWLAEKKPYQIKLKDKTDLLETGDKENASKTWVLLTNHSDASQLRNRTVYDLSVAMGMEPGIQCRPVNLFYDGEYRGTYLLCEKVEIKSGRVDIEDMEETIEETNPDIEDFDSLPTATATTSNGATYIYCPDLKSPENITGGFLLELDTSVRAAAEKCYFMTKHSNYIVVKSPEYCSKEAMEYIATYYQEFEDALYNMGTHPENGKTIEDYADITSLAQCYIINELTKNPDGYRTSCYFYKDADSDVLMAGPIWDYDLSFGQGWGQYVSFCAEPTGYFTLFANFSKELYHYGPFRQAVHDIYMDQVSALVTEQVLPSFRENVTAITNAALANNQVWNRSASSFTSACKSVESYITTRNAWLTEAFANWNGESEENMNLFHDVQETDWFYDAVIDATQLGLINGMGFGIYAPHKTATRAQATKILWVMGGSRQATEITHFPDVDAMAWYAPAVAWAKENGVVNGYADGNFGPEDPITRQDLVTLLYRWSGEKQEDLSSFAKFDDGAIVSLYAREAICWAIEKGILTGYTDNTLRPKNEITRAELAAVMVRYCNAG